MSSRFVLLVEDDPVARTLMAAILQEAGYVVASAANGREALEILHQGELPLLILLDMKMPVMSGLEFLEVRRGEPALAGVPVVVLSGDDELDDSLGFVRCLTKPVDPDELLEIIRKHSEKDVPDC